MNWTRCYAARGTPSIAPTRKIDLSRSAVRPRTPSLPQGGEAKTAVPYKVTERIIAVVQHVRAVPNCPTPSSTTSARQTARLCKPRKLYVSRRPSKPEGGRWTNAYDGARVAFLNDDELNAIFSPTSVNTSGCCNGFCVVDPANNTKKCGAVH